MGAGIWGCAVTRRLAAETGCKILVLERRPVVSDGGGGESEFGLYREIESWLIGVGMDCLGSGIIFNAAMAEKKSENGEMRYSAADPMCVERWHEAI